MTRGAGPVSTVAERLEPESLFEQFVAFREGLGIEVVPHTGGPSPFGVMAQRLRAWPADLPDRRPGSQQGRG